jgi:hypothetical protein
MGKPWADHGQGYDESPTRATQLATSSWSFSLVGADDGIRTRDPHHGKVLRNVQAEVLKAVTWSSVCGIVHCVHGVRPCSRAVYYRHDATKRSRLLFRSSTVARYLGTGCRQQ